MKRYKLIPAICFIVIVFSIFCLNMGESIKNFDTEKLLSKKTLKKTLAGLDSVESIKYGAVNINGAWQRMTGHSYLYDVSRSNDLYRLPGDYLVTAKSKQYKDDDIDASSITLSDTYRKLKAEGRDMLYVQCFGKKVLLPDSAFSSGVLTSQNESVERFTENVRKSGIPLLDTKEMMENDGMKSYFKTDHHWTMEKAFDAYSAICGRLSDDGFDIPKDRYAKESFDFKVHKGTFLGTEGRRVGRYYIGLDDIADISPSFDTSFRVRVPDKGIDRKGDFRKAIMDPSKDPAHYSFTDSAYYIYWGGDYKEVIVDNYQDDVKGTALVVKDSYGIPVSAFLTNAFKKTIVTDLRYNKKDTLSDLITRYSPDIVIYIYGTGYLDDTKLFSY